MITTNGDVPISPVLKARHEELAKKRKEISTTSQSNTDSRERKK